jgi:hypothetical protein
VHHGGHGDAFERTIDDPHGIALGGFRVVAQPGLVELDDIGARGLQVECLGIDGGGEVHRHLLVVLVELVFGLLRHGEGAG